jgi:predicted DNA-binding transcriptional regulator YafY
MASDNSKNGRSHQLVRQWAILRMLENREYSVRELAAELGSSKSSIQRDIVTLQEHFMIVAISVGQQKRVYRLERQRAPRSIRFARDELAAFDRILHEHSGDDDCTSLLSLRRKLHAIASDPNG